MKRTLFSLLLVSILTTLLPGCMSVKSLGPFNAIAGKNVDLKTSGDLVSLASATSINKREVKRIARTHKAVDLRTAVNVAVNQYPGGTLLMNGEAFYVRRHLHQDVLVAVGDVWGTPNGNFSGFITGQEVLYMKKGKGTKAKISGFLDNTTAIIVLEGKDTPIEVPITDLGKQ